MMPRFGNSCQSEVWFRCFSFSAAALEPCFVVISTSISALFFVPSGTSKEHLPAQATFPIRANSASPRTIQKFRIIASPHCLSLRPIRQVEKFLNRADSPPGLPSNKDLGFAYVAIVRAIRLRIPQ